MPTLKLWQQYGRKDVHDILDADAPFSSRGGKWGESGMIRLSADGDFNFFVTFGSSQGSHDFKEEISEDGVLTWQSQPSKRLSSPIIQQLIDHDDMLHNVHLFLRTRKYARRAAGSAAGSRPEPYTYLGHLGYLTHDKAREKPVYFTWQLMDWPPPPGLMSGMGITLTAPSDPVAPLNPAHNTLTQTPAPAARRRGGGGGGGRQAASLPGQDAKNRALGLAGELLVLSHEQDRLTAAGRTDLAARIVHTAVDEGDSAGYDVRSFNADDSDRHIEVKTTAGPASNAFFISPNEIDFSRRHPDSYVLVRLYGYSRAANSANYYELAGSVDDHFELTASEFRARLLPSP